MSKINIYGKHEITDQYYRYKMEKLNVIVEKNKIKITNLGKVAEDLRIDKFLITDLFKIYLGCNIIQAGNIITITSNKLSYDNFYNVLRELIEYLILCPKCIKPETTLSIVSNNVFMVCACCNFSGKVIDHKKILPKQILKLMENLIKKK
jgi:translation initiation factor 2 beta subunit (eIF-2beta)/eIF-5